MECKLLIIAALLSLIGELIETLWNVNSVKAKASSFWTIELIETLWNVNVIIDKHDCVVAGELIETLWNVNPRGYFQIGDGYKN